MRKQLQRIMLWLLLTLLLLTPIPTAAAKGSYHGSMAGDGMGILAYGVDLSSWQGDSVDFHRIREQGIDFVILRAGFSQTRDAVFERNYAEAKAAGLDVGAYLYSYAATAEEVLAEVESCKSWLAGKQFEYPIYFDLEDPEVHGAMSSDSLTELALTFLDSLSADGWLVGLYSCRSWLEGKMDTRRIGETYECWMAQYPSDCDCSGYERYHDTYGIWQYSASGTVDGVPGKTDMNVAFKDYPSICREYGLNGYSAQGETLTLTGASVPAVQLLGEPFEVSGSVRSSEGALLRVSLGVYDAEGNLAAGATAEPNSDSFDLSLIRRSVDMTRLTEGEYTYRITAATEQTERSLQNSRFVICKNGLWLRDLSLLTDLKEGEAFDVGGTVLCAEDMTRLRLEITDENGNVKFSKGTEPRRAEADISALSLELSTLKKGEYRLRAVAETAHGERKVTSEPFNVWVRDDPITLSGFRLNKTYAPAALTGLSGTAESAQSEMRLEVSLLDSDGTLLYSAQANRTAKTVNLAQFDDVLHLTDLPLGSYVLQIIATNDGGPSILYRDSFSVVRDEISLCGAVLPTSICAGDCFLLSGAITSDRSPLCFVGAVLLDDRGVPVRNYAAQPNRTVFDMDGFNAALRFSDLSAGDYRLRITAENSGGRKTLFDETIAVTDNAAPIRWDGAHTELQGLCFSEGEAPVCFGTLVADTPITSLRASVTDEERIVRSEAIAETDAEVLSVAQLNEQLRLSALPAGEYRLELYAACGTTEQLVLRDSFSVADCSHDTLRSGTDYPASCRTVGATCPTRCLRCGGTVTLGSVCPKSEHTVSDGICTVCGTSAPRSYPAEPLSAALDSDGRYALALQTETGWYVLNASGETLRFDERPTELPSDCLWSAEPYEDGTIALCSYRGERLHLDSDGLCVAAGCGHVRLQIAAYRDGVTFVCGGRALCFSDGAFTVGDEATRLIILSLCRMT